MTVTNPFVTTPQAIRRSADAAMSAVHREAFRALLGGHAPTAAEIATAATLSTDQLADAISGRHRRDRDTPRQSAPTNRHIGHGICTERG
jgi:hypothetical protein